MSPDERMARAEDYVFGLMDEHERERAERDMERDPEFRDCVMVLAERLRQLKSRQSGAGPADAWDEISRRIAEMPQMGEGAAKAVRRDGRRRFVGRGAHETGGRRGMLVATGMALVFLLGYLAGKF